MSETSGKEKDIRLEFQDAQCYYTSLIRLLDKIELNEGDERLKDDLLNIYRLLKQIATDDFKQSNIDK